MALSFLFIAFIRVLELLRLRGSDTTDLVIEVVILRHEVVVLRRQVAWPALRPADRALLTGLSRLLSRARRSRFFVQPETFAGLHRDLVRRRRTYPHSPRAAFDPSRHSAPGGPFWPRRTCGCRKSHPGPHAARSYSWMRPPGGVRASVSGLSTELLHAGGIEHLPGSFPTLSIPISHTLVIAIKVAIPRSSGPDEFSAPSR